MSINARNKGSRNERHVCKMLEDWTGRKFAKTPASGGLHWNISQACGDVICLDEKHKFPFAIETKFYNKIDFSQLLTLKSKEIFEWWAQAVRDSKEARKYPLMLLRYNNLPKNFYFCFLEIKIAKGFPRTLKSFLKTRINYYGKYRLVIMRSDELFKIPYMELKNHLKNESPKNS